MPNQCCFSHIIVHLFSTLQLSINAYWSVNIPFHYFREKRLDQWYSQLLLLSDHSVQQYQLRGHSSYMTHKQRTMGNQVEGLLMNKMDGLLLTLTASRCKQLWWKTCLWRTKTKQRSGLQYLSLFSQFSMNYRVIHVPTHTDDK